MTHPAYVSSPLSEAALNHARDGIAHVRKAPGSKEATQHMLGVINTLTEEAMHYYFQVPMEIIKAGAFTQKVVRMGVAGSVKMVNSMAKKAASSLSDEQMLELCDFIDEIIHEREE